MADRAGDRGLNCLADWVGQADKSEITSERGDYPLTLVLGALAHDVAEGLSQFLHVVVGHCGSAGANKFKAISLDDRAADGGSEVASEGFVDFGAEPLVSDDEGDFLEKLVTIEPSLATGGLAERSHDVLGLDLVDRRRAGGRFGSRGWLNSSVGSGCFGRGALSGERWLFA